MGFRYVVLGAGRQGVALAFDLLKNCDADEVRLFDASEAVVHGAQTRLLRLLPSAAGRLHAAPAELADESVARSAMRGAQVAISAAPYRLNLLLTRAALDEKVSFCDLGGNTAMVRSQLALHERAGAAGVSVVPDCGLAPGLGNILAAYGIGRVDAPIEVHVRCGGLPQKRVGPLGYKMLFHFQGLINEYSGLGEFIRDGRRIDVPTLTELEEIEFPEPIGRCEAAVTSGGTSTCAESFLGRVQSYDYKTVRYPGHWAVIRAMFELGCFEERVTLRDGRTLEPKPMIKELFESRLAFPDVRDVTVLRTTVTGQRGGRRVTLEFELVDRQDEATGLSAMERTTAFPTTLVAFLQARREIAPGARPLENCLPLDTYMSELAAHDIHVARRER